MCVCVHTRLRVSGAREGTVWLCTCQGHRFHREETLRRTELSGAPKAHSVTTDTAGGETQAEAEGTRGGLSGSGGPRAGSRPDPDDGISAIRGEGVATLTRTLLTCVH